MAKETVSSGNIIESLRPKKEKHYMSNVQDFRVLEEAAFEHC